MFVPLRSHGCFILQSDLRRGWHHQRDYHHLERGCVHAGRKADRPQHFGPAGLHRWHRLLFAHQVDQVSLDVEGGRSFLFGQIRAEKRFGFPSFLHRQGALQQHSQSHKSGRNGYVKLSTGADEIEMTELRHNLLDNAQDNGGEDEVFAEAGLLSPASAQRTDHNRLLSASSSRSSGPATPARVVPV